MAIKYRIVTTIEKYDTETDDILDTYMAQKSMITSKKVRIMKIRKYPHEECIIAIGADEGFASVLYSKSKLINDDIASQQTWEMDNLGFSDVYPEKPGIYRWTGTIIHLSNKPNEISEVEYVCDKYDMLYSFDPAEVIQLDPWRNDPDYPTEDWTDEVIAGATRLGYLAWVDHQRAIKLDDQAAA